MDSRSKSIAEGAMASPGGEAVERSETEEECGRQGADFGKALDFYRVCSSDCEKV